MIYLEYNIGGDAMYNELKIRIRQMYPDKSERMAYINFAMSVKLSPDSFYRKINQSRGLNFSLKDAFVISNALGLTIESLFGEVIAN
jgi:hypothetical protein